MTDVEKLVEKMFNSSMHQSYRENMRTLLRIVLSEIQNGGVVEIDTLDRKWHDRTGGFIHKEPKVYLKPDFQKFLEEK